MSDRKIFGIDDEKSLSIMEDLYELCQRHGTGDVTAMMIGYSAFLIPHNIYCEGWRSDAIGHAVKVLGTIARDRMAEIKAAGDQVKEAQTTYECKVDWESWIEELMKAGDTDDYIQ